MNKTAESNSDILAGQDSVNHALSATEDRRHWEVRLSSAIQSITSRRQR